MAMGVAIDESRDDQAPGRINDLRIGARDRTRHDEVYDDVAVNHDVAQLAARRVARMVLFGPMCCARAAINRSTASVVSKKINAWDRST